MDTSLTFVSDNMVNIEDHRKMIKNYKQAIDILDEILGEYASMQELVTRIARNNPDILVNAYDYVKYDKDDDMKKEAIHLINSNLYIQAIKHVREKTGWGLKESKAYCDELREKSCSPQ